MLDEHGMWEIDTDLHNVQMERVKYRFQIQSLNVLHDLMKAVWRLFYIDSHQYAAVICVCFAGYI